MENIEPLMRQESEIDKYLIWKTDNELLLHLDARRDELNKRIAMLEDQIEEKSPSQTTGRSIKQRAGDIRSLARQVKPATNFEEILLKDILMNSNAAFTFASFVFDKKPTRFTRSGQHFSVATYLRNYFGLIPRESPYNILLRTARNQDHHTIHRHYELTHSMRRRSRDVYLKGTLQDLEEKILPKVKKVMLDFAREMHMPQEGIKNFEVYFDQTRGGFSYYDGANKLASLDPTEIILYNDNNGQEKIFEGKIMLEGTHEKVHDLHRVFSEISFAGINGLIGSEESYNNMLMGLSEGIARRTERFSLMFFFKKHQEEFGLTNNDLEIMKYDSKFNIIRRANQTVYTILKIIQSTESLHNFDSYKKLSEITGIPLFARDPYIMDDLPLTGHMYYVSSLLGLQYVKKCIQETNEKYGKDQVDDNLGLILRGFMTGHWQFQAHYRFFNEEYLPRLEGLGCLRRKTDA